VALQELRCETKKGMATELALVVVTPDEQTHRFVARENEPLQRLADEFFAHAQSCGLLWPARAFVLTFDGEPLDYSLTPEALGLEEEDFVDLVPYPAWPHQSWLPCTAASDVIVDRNLLALIMQSLSALMLSRTAVVCRTWRDASSSNMLWLQHVKSTFPGAHEFSGVESFKMLYARLRGRLSPEPPQPQTKLSDYQLFVSLRCYGETVLSGGLQGNAPVVKLDGEGVRVSWYLDMPDTEWFWNALSDETIDGTAEALQIRLNGDAANDERVYKEAIEEFTQCIRKSEVQNKVLARVEAFRKRDQRVARILNSGLNYSVQWMDGTLRFRMGEAYCNEEPYFVATLAPAFVGASGTSRMRWELCMCLERTTYPNLPDDEEDYSEFDFEEDEQTETMSQSALLCALERAQWT
jgi:hypothetical protein